MIEVVSMLFLVVKLFSYISDLTSPFEVPPWTDLPPRPPISTALSGIRGVVTGGWTGQEGVNTPSSRLRGYREDKMLVYICPFLKAKMIKGRKKENYSPGTIYLSVCYC